MCVITLKDPLGLGNPPNHIWVRGDVEDCGIDVDQDDKQLTVGVSCTGSDGPFSEAQLDADNSGSWEAVLPIEECGCGNISDNPLFVRVICNSDDSCTVLETYETLVCGECPEIRYGDDPTDVSPPPLIECQDDGSNQATISFAVTVFNITSEDRFIRFRLDPPGAGSLSSANPVSVPAGTSQGIAVSGTMNTPIVNTRVFASVEDANGQELECPALTIDLENKPCCEPPRFVNEQIEIDGCTVTVQGEVDPPAACEFNWKFGECTSQNPCPNMSDDEELTTVPTASYTYENPGSYTITVNARCGGCSTTSVFEVEIESCEPDDDGNGGNGGGNGDGDGDGDGDGGFDWCVLNGILLGLLIAAYIVGMATGVVADISQDLLSLPELNAATITGVVGAGIGVLMTIYAAYCGLCRLGRAMFWGGLLGLVAILLLGLAVLLGAGIPLPYFWAAFITAVVFVLGGWAIITKECESFT